MSAVAKLHSDVVPMPVPALGFSVQIDLGAGRAAVFQTAVASDCNIAELNTLLDKINRAGDRQRAHYKIEEEERAIELIENEQRLHTEDLAAVDERFEKEQAQRTEALLKAETARSNFFTVKQEEHERRGARGAFEPRGAEKTQVNGLDKGVDQLKTDIINAKAERDKTHAQYADVKKKRADLVAKHRKEIARCQEIVSRGLAV